jgi:UDP-N-acetylmuramate--alanine ligase
VRVNGDITLFRKSKKMHFIGIGGIGMSGIAGILIDMGYEVSGSDLHESEQTRMLGCYFKRDRYE